MPDVMTASQGWDWKGQIDLDALAADLDRLSEGRIRLYQPDTGSDGYGYVLTTVEMTADQVLEVFYSEGETLDGSPE